MVSTGEVLTRSIVHPEAETSRLAQLALPLDLGAPVAVSHDVDFDSSDALRVGRETEKSGRSITPTGFGKCLTPAQQAKGAQASLIWGDAMRACRLSSSALAAAADKGEKYFRQLADPHSQQAWTGRDLLVIGEHYPAFQAEVARRLDAAVVSVNRTPADQLMELTAKLGELAKAQCSGDRLARLRAASQVEDAAKAYRTICEKEGK